MDKILKFWSKFGTYKISTPKGSAIEAFRSSPKITSPQWRFLIESSLTSHGISWLGHTSDSIGSNYRPATKSINLSPYNIAQNSPSVEFAHHICLSLNRIILFVVIFQMKLMVNVWANMDNAWVCWVYINRCGLLQARDEWSFPAVLSHVMTLAFLKICLLGLNISDCGFGTFFGT